MKTFVGVVTVIGLLSLSARAHAQCCPGYSPATACEGVTLTKTRWCIQDTSPDQDPLPVEFCSYGDKVVTTLENTFNIPSEDIFEIELDTETGGAHTGTACANVGEGVAYDAFKGSAYGTTGFYGYLLSLHEAINVWTGMASPGWPTDWWADHQSAFPNLMDFHIMATIGVETGNQNLINSAAAQKERFYLGGDSADAKVVAIDNVFQMMPGGDGYAGFSEMFKLVSEDEMLWDGLGVPNPEVKRSEYVVAYMSLAARQPVLATLQGPGARGGGDICNNVFDGTDGDAPYTCSKANIDAIATAHCALAANGNPMTNMEKFRSGDYSTIPSGPCGATCPVECGCDTQNHCVAPWLGTRSSGGGGAGGANAGGAGGANAGGTPGIGGSATAGSTGVTGGAAGSGTSGPPAAGGPSNGAAPSDSRCTCRAIGGPGDSRFAGWLATAALAALALARAHRRKR